MAHGHCNVPWSWKDEDGFALGAWVSTQRSQHKKYAEAPSSSWLPAERGAALARVGREDHAERRTETLLQEVWRSSSQ